MDTIFWQLQPHKDLSLKSCAQTPQVWRSTEGESALRQLELSILSTLKPEFSLSNDHLSLPVVMSSENMGMDHLSEDPPLEPLVDSLLQSRGRCEEASPEIENDGDLHSRIWLAW